MPSETKTFLDSCNSCGKCQKICPFLSSYGTPDDIIVHHPQDAFLCTNCGKCTSICPEEISPSEALFETKYHMIKNGLVSNTIRTALASAHSFTMRGHRFPFSYYPSTDTVFWPGCALSGTSPEIVKKTTQLLSKHLNKRIGLALDCCFDPLYQIGSLDEVREAVERIKKRLGKNGINHVITGCANCKKIFSLYLPEVKVEYILEVLPDNSINPPTPPLFLHHPCPSFRFDEIRQRAKIYINGDRGLNESLTPSCCGSGGGLSSLSNELSDKFTERVIKASNGNPIVTYCMGCKSRLLQKGKSAYHLLEFLPGVKPIEEPVSSIKKWTNRLILSLYQRLNSKKLFLGLIVFFLILLTTYLRKNGYISTDGIFEFLQKYKVAAPLLFILIYSIGPSLFIPSLPLTLGAGFLWGPLWGVLFSITGATSGASVAFLVSRYLMGNTVKERFGYNRWKWLKEKVERHGWKAVAFARIVPILPFPALNYLFGVTPISFLHYLWSTFVFMLPACVAYVAFGSSMGELILKGNVKGLIIGIIVSSVALLLPFVLKPLVRKVSSAKEN